MNSTSNNGTATSTGSSAGAKKAETYYSYGRHEDEGLEILADPDRSKHSETWFRTDTLDAWRHARMYEPLKALLLADAEGSWLTVGDGRYGTDANFLLRSGARKVHCTNISDALLKIGSERGFIGEYSAENAEALRFADNTFDYVFCKESLHHFPRPYAALYEMFRVAKKAVILTEPRDQELEPTVFPIIRRVVTKLFGRPARGLHGFEPIGNYIYSVSERELQKFLLGMHYTNMACIGCNDAYEEGVAFITMDTADRKERAVINRIKRSIRLQDWYARVGLRKSGLLTAALFKGELVEAVESSLRQSGWAVTKLPRNPYL